MHNGGDRHDVDHTRIDRACIPVYLLCLVCLCNPCHVPFLPCYYSVIDDLGRTSNWMPKARAQTHIYIYAYIYIYIYISNHININIYIYIYIYTYIMYSLSLSIYIYIYIYVYIYIYIYIYICAITANAQLMRGVYIAGH